MTVVAETPATTTATPEQQMDEIYRRWWKPLHYFILARVDDRHRPQAEDLAADTFLQLWTKFLAAGREVWAPWGLLCTLGRQIIADFYGVKANRYLELSVDFSDPANRGIERGHSYAPTQPEAAVVAEELGAALERMAELSQLWRDKHAETHKFRMLLDDSNDRQPLTRKNRVEAEAKLSAAAVEGAKLLESFRRACGRVGALRIELEEAGGPNWCSSTGMPPTASRSNVKPGTMGDPTRSHCEQGHELTLENTYFNEKGRKRCRACVSDRQKSSYQAARAGKTPAPSAAVSEEAIDRARELLKDPKLSLTKVAALVGISRSTLVARVPDMDKLRDPDAFKVKRTPQEVIDRAAALLLAPEQQLTVPEVAAEVGVSVATLYYRIPNLTERRRAVYEGTLAGAGAAK